MCCCNANQATDAEHDDVQEQREIIIEAFSCPVCSSHGIETTSIADQVKRSPEL